MQVLGLSAKWFIDCDVSHERLEPACPQVYSIGGTNGTECWPRKVLDTCHPERLALF